MERVRELNETILALNYEKVQEMLADLEVPINLSMFNIPLPLDTVLKVADSRMIRLFLKCPRVDWLAPSWNRNFLTLERDYGIKYLPSILPRNMRDSFFKGKVVKTVFDYFYYCPLPEELHDEEQLIYEKIIAELVREEDKDDFCPLLFNTVDSFVAFKIALKYCQDVNCRDDKGQTLLHRTASEEVARLLIEMGVDVNALDNQERTPLMLQSLANHVGIVKLFITNGADVLYVNSRGYSNSRHLCGQFQLFYPSGDIPKEVFLALLKQGRIFEENDLEFLFRKRPEYKQIFFSDLPEYLPAAYDNLRAFNLEHWTEAEWLQFARNVTSRCNYVLLIGLIACNKLLVESFANELFHLAVKADANYIYEELFFLFKADPNGLIDGKRPLFVAGPNGIEKLLKLGADPFIQCDGLYFFERENFCQDSKELRSEWLIELHKQKFDLFSRECQSGKSLIDFLDPEMQVSFPVSCGELPFPVSKLSKSFLDLFIKYRGPDLFDAIDEERNSLSHYFFASQYRKYVNDFYKSDSMLISFPFYKIEAYRNKAGISALSTLIENDPEFFAVRLLKGLDDLNVYLSACEAYYGLDFVEKYGCYLIQTICQEQLIEYLIAERNISIAAVCQNLNNAPLDAYIFKKFFASMALDTPQWLLDQSYQVGIEEIHQVVKSSNLKLLARVLEQYEGNWTALIYHVCQDCTFNDGLRLFIKHPKVQQARPANCDNDCRTIEQCFFALCHGKEKAAQFLVELGFDAKKLIGSGLFAKSGGVSYPNYTGPVRVDFLKYLKELGWTRADLQKICFESGKTLYEDFKLTPNFSLVFDVIAFESPNLDDLVGDKSNCSIGKVS